MNKKNIRNLVLAFLAAVAVYFSPIASTDAAAADFTSSELSSVSKDYLGTPYRSGGTTTAGFDCSGYVQFVYKKLGVSLPRTSRDMYSTGSAVSKGNLQSGDLVFFNTSGSGVSHVGIYIGNSQFIHSASSKGVSIASINDPYYWGSRYIGAKRVADVN